MKDQNKAYFFVFLAIAFWSTMGSAFKLSLQYLSYTSLLLYSSAISLAALAFLISINKKWKHVSRMTPGEWGRSAMMGLLNPFVYYLILFKSYSLIPAQEAVALNYTWPLVLVVLSVFILKQKLSLKSLLAILICFLGAVLVVTQGDFSFLSIENPLGSLLALGSSVLWATFWLLNVRDHRLEEIKLFANFLFGTLFSLIWVSLFSSFDLPPLKGFLGFIYIGLFEMGFTFFFWLKALQYSTTTARVTKLVYLSPFLSLILIHFLVGESIGSFTVVGLLLIIGGILWEAADKNKNIAL